MIKIPGDEQEKGGNMKLRGVNLGNWLVLEKWMKPELFQGVNGEDELDFVTQLPGQESRHRLKEHYETYVTEKDIAFLAEAGVNLLRIPIPYYIYGDVDDRLGSIEYLDLAFDWAEKYGLKILIDLHSVRGGQNGFDNSGTCGLCTWHKHPEYVEETLKLLERIAKRYQSRQGLFGIEPINEPANQNIMQAYMQMYREKYPERVAISEAVPDNFLEKFYLEVYRRLRPILPKDAVIVLSDQFDLSKWENFMPREQYPGVWLDAHKYLCFAEGSILYEGENPNLAAYSTVTDGMRGRLVLQNYLRLINDVFLADIRQAARFHPVMVGEWSIVQNMEDIKNAKNIEEQKNLYRAISDAQIAAWEEAEGGAYWSYRVTDQEDDAWDFRKCVQNGWLSYR